MVKDIRESPDHDPEPPGPTPGTSPTGTRAQPGGTAHAQRPLVVQAGAAFRSLHAAVETLIDAAAQRYGVNRNDQRCLELLDRHGPLTAGRLAEIAGLSAAAVTKVVDRLLAAGYVQRTRAETDRRQVIIVTTPAEQRLAAEVFGPVIADGARLLSELPDEQLEMLRDVIGRAAALNLAHAERIRRSAGPDVAS